MRRLNVQSTQIDECIQKHMFAISVPPHNPELQPGELLLLQLVKHEAVRLGKVHSRIDFALVFNRIERDYDGTISRSHWPKAERTWPWIVFCSDTIPTIPFSLEDLKLSMEYGGQTNPRYIQPRDEQLIMPYIQGSLAQVPKLSLQLVPASRIAQKFGKQPTLSAIYNHDRIAILHPVPKKLVSREEFERNQYLADSLKSYYESRCQVCDQDFLLEYGVPFSETHHIQYLARGGPDVSGNIVVLCPNHHRIIHATNARFNRQNLAYEYPNGLCEPLIRTDHFQHALELFTP